MGLDAFSWPPGLIEFDGASVSLTSYRSSWHGMLACLLAAARASSVT